MSDRASVEGTDWKFIASKIWFALMMRSTPQQISALERIGRSHPTTRELADYLDISQAQAANVATRLYRDGLIDRKKAGRTYRYFPAFPTPMPFHYFDRRAMPLVIPDSEAQRIADILAKRKKD